MLALLGDSRPLFGKLLLPRMRERWSQMDAVRAVYLGAANGDAPEHFALFTGAMDAHGITQVAHVRAGDATALDEADVVFLAGGDPLLGLRSLRDSGLLARVLDRHRAGAMLIGSSAGSMLLGARVWDGEDAASIVEGAQLVPFAMHAHAEPDWSRLKRLAAHEPDLRCIGLCSGGGAWVDGEVLTAVGSGIVAIRP